MYTSKLTLKRRLSLASTVLGLSLADLKHEWILTLCLILAIAAIVAPLLLLMGLKHGTIWHLKEQLVQDPKYREIRPTQVRSYPLDWFDRLATRKEVAFLIPTILPASSMITVMSPDTGKIRRGIDLIPTGANDPLILENGGEVPNANQCVLTSVAAEELGNVKVGDMITSRVTRYRKGRREVATAKLKVVAILSPRAGILERIYVPLDFATAVENYREGRAVPELGWAGEAAAPYLSFDGVIVLLPEALAPIQRGDLTINTGLTDIKNLNSEEFQSLTGFSLISNRVAYHLKVSIGGSTVRVNSLVAVKNKLRGRNAILLPYVAPFEVFLGEDLVRVFGLSLSSQQAEMLGVEPLPWKRFSLKRKSRRSPKNLNQVLLPKSSVLPVQAETTLRISGKTEPLLFPVKILDKGFSHHALIPIELAATLRTGIDRQIIYDKVQNTFLLSRIDFRGFRLYTNTIDDVHPIYRVLREQEIEVTAQLESIERVRILDRGLTRIFWLIAIVGIGGGLLALVTSLYAAVERKKKDIAVMRLIGLSRFDVSCFPIYQGVTIAILGIMVATTTYFLLAGVINYTFSSDLEMGQKICHLSSSHLVYATFITVVGAFFSSLLAAWKAIQIDPAEALREE